jgi:hypothetical protein
MLFTLKKYYSFGRYIPAVKNYLDINVRDALEQETVERLVPLGLSCAVRTGWRFVHTVADSDSAVRIHSGQAVIFCELCFGNGHCQPAEYVGRRSHDEGCTAESGNWHASFGCFHVQLFLKRHGLEK